MKNLTLEKFKSVYEKEELGKNAICNECDAKVKLPLLPWIVGSKYEQTKERILFVGKPHRGEPGEKLDSGILDSTKPHLDWLKDCSWAYWNYTKNIAAKLYGFDDPWDHVAFTNVIKCTNVTGVNGSVDTTSRIMAKNCISDNQVLFKEIEILKPKTIVFFTYDLYREFLVDLPFADEVKVISDSDHKVKCGNKYIGWWFRRIKTSWSDTVSILVTHHPERKKKDDYIGLISEWIKSES